MNTNLHGVNDLQTALARRDTVLDKMLVLSDYAPMTLKRAALNTFLLTGHQEKGIPMELRRAQESLLDLLGER